MFPAFFIHISTVNELKPKIILYYMELLLNFELNNYYFSAHYNRTAVVIFLLIFHLNLIEEKTILVLLD